MYQKSSDLRKYLIISIYIDFLRFYFPFFCIHWLMGYINGKPLSDTTTSGFRSPPLRRVSVTAAD